MTRKASPISASRAYLLARRAGSSPREGTTWILEIFDEHHSDAEDRFIAIGPIERGLVLVVWTERDGDTIRIISARWATARERRLYVEYSARLP
jgi:hypothetical protein